MASTNETGHARNIANFNQVIAICTRIGADYKPSNDNLKLARIQQLYTAADAAKMTLDTALANFNLTVTNREEIFDRLPKLITRINGYLSSIEVSDGILADVKTITRKISSNRKKKTTTTTGTTNTTEAETVTHSDSHRSFDNLVSNFHSLVELLAAIPGYSPEEDTLKITALNNFHDSLKDYNNAVVTTSQPVSTARKLRDSYLYAPEIGMVDTYKKIKAYTKGLKGMDSQEYKDLVKLKFSMPKEIDANLTFTLTSPV